MNNSKCPSWLYNDWCVPHYYVFVLSYLILILPFLILWKKLYKRNKSKISSVLDYCKLILLTEISMFIYNLSLFLIGTSASQNKIGRWGEFLATLSFGSYYFIIFFFFLTLIFVCLYVFVREIVLYRKKKS
jgi:hypothetical protein